MGNPESERRATYYDQPWAHEAVPRYFYNKVTSFSTYWAVWSVWLCSLDPVQVTQRKAELEQALGIRQP